MDQLTPAATISPLRQRLIDDMNMRRFSRETQRNYIRDIGRFASFLGRSPHTATAEDVRRFQIEQRDAGMGLPTMNSIVSALRFLFTSTLDRPDLARKLVRVVHPRNLPVVLSRDEVARLLAATTCLKHQAALSVAYGAGLRVAEVATLKVADIDSERMLIRVERGKGGQYRNAMLAADLLTLLREWWRAGREQGVMYREGWLFPGQHATKPISTRQLHRVVVDAAQAEIAKRVGPHTLRHSFATHLLEDGVDIRVIQVLLGHAKIDNTALYTKVATRTVRAVTSPLDKLGMLKVPEITRQNTGEGVPAREADLLPVGYFHVVFSLPAEIADIAAQNKAAVYDLLFRAASQTMLTIAADPRHLGARIGITAVLHSWGSALTHHPHIHMIVPGGGISLDGQRWVSSRPAFLLPVRVLGKLFRRLFLTRLVELFDAGRLQFHSSRAALRDRRAFLRHLAPTRNTSAR